jgi:hypothetical protein
LKERINRSKIAIFKTAFLYRLEILYVSDKKRVTRFLNRDLYRLEMALHAHLERQKSSLPTTGFRSRKFRSGWVKSAAGLAQLARTFWKKPPLKEAGPTRRRNPRARRPA